jgi:hypothetical protein
MEHKTLNHNIFRACGTIHDYKRNTTFIQKKIMWRNTSNKIATVHNIRPSEKKSLIVMEQKIQLYLEKD